MIHVPYKGASPAVADLIAQVQLMIEINPLADLAIRQSPCVGRFHVEAICGERFVACRGHGSGLRIARVVRLVRACRDAVGHCGEVAHGR